MPSGIAVGLVVASQSVILATTAAAGSERRAAPRQSVGVKAPATAKAGLLTAITLTLPSSVAAVDGRVLVDAMPPA